jgi:hypothetical protein
MSLSTIGTSHATSCLHAIKGGNTFNPHSRALKESTGATVGRGVMDMHAFLLAIGVIATAIGMFTIGFGIPINEFSFGNTLIIAGTICVIGGLVLIGIAAAVRELRRTADAVGGRSLMRGTRPESGEPAVQGLGARSGSGVARGTFPQKPNSEGLGREQRTPEPRLAAVFSNDGPQVEMPTGRPRPNIFPMVRAVGDATVVEEPESVPLSPHAPARGPVPMRAERAPEARSMPQPASKQSSGVAPAARSAVLEAPRLGSAGERPVDQPQRANMFDAVWPTELKAEVRSGAAVATEARAPTPAPVAARERIEPVAEKQEEVAPTVQRAASELRAVSILKSGVIDGMAYTLYTDGAIEAHLAQGTMRFGSIDELREHLENNQ